MRPRPRPPSDALVARLRAAGCVFAEDEAGLLVEHADGDAAALEALVVARAAGRPLEHLLGWVGFDGHRVVVGPGVFVPRQRSVLLVEEAARLAPTGGTVVDLCCGCGALGLALSHRRPDVALWAADLDPAAVACARDNLAGLFPDSSEHVLEGDLYAALAGVQGLRGHVDVLVVNAPYVPSDSIASMPPEARDHEARLALDGGPDGLDVHRRVVAGAGAWLAPGGALLVEVAPAQVEAALALLAAYGLNGRWVRDESPSVVDRGGSIVCGLARLDRAGSG